MTEISIYTEDVGAGISDLFSSRTENSPAVMLAPGHTQSPHRGCRLDLSLYAPFKEPIPRLEGDCYSSVPIVVRSFPNAVVFSNCGVVRDTNGFFVTQTLGALRYLNPHISRLSDVPFLTLPPDEIAHGNYVYASHGNYPVYSHFLFETIGTVYLLRSLFSAGLVSLAYPSSPQPWMDSLLDYMEIPRCNRHPLKKERTQFGNLLLSSHCSDHNTFSPNPVIKDVAKHFLDKWGSKSGQRSRLYLTREGFENTTARRYAQDAELSSMLKDLDFITLNPATLPFEEQVRLFSTAEIVVGAHGSAFANLIFAPPGCKVIDILHAEWALAGGCFTVNVTNLFGQEYASLIAESTMNGSELTLSLDPKLVYERVKRFLKS